MDDQNINIYLSQNAWNALNTIRNTLNSMTQNKLVQSVLSNVKNAIEVKCMIERYMGKEHSVNGVNLPIEEAEETTAHLIIALKGTNGLSFNGNSMVSYSNTVCRNELKKNDQEDGYDYKMNLKELIDELHEIAKTNHFRIEEIEEQQNKIRKDKAKNKVMTPLK